MLGGGREGGWRKICRREEEKSIKWRKRTGRKKGREMVEWRMK